MKWALCAILALFIACHSVEHVVNSTMPPLSYRRTMCFGPCAAFTFVLEENGMAELSLIRGAHNTPLEALAPGNYRGTMTMSDPTDFVAMLKAVNYFQLDSVYDNPRVMDLPAIETIIDGYSVYNRYQGPELEALYTLLDSMLFSVNWAPIEDF